MPEIVGRARMPRLASAPASPALGEMYYNTTTNVLYYWDGTAWVSTKSVAGTVYDVDPIGTVKSTTATVIETNWMLADGRTLNRADYPQLADKMGIPAGQSTFTLPDLRKKFIYGKNAPTDPIVNGGAATVTLTAAQSGMPAHNTNAMDRSIDHLHSAPYTVFYGPGGNNWQSVTGGGGMILGWSHTGASDRSLDHLHGVSAVNASAAHENLPPHVELAWIIKVTGPTIDPGGALVGATGPQGPAGQTVDWYCQIIPSASLVTSIPTTVWTVLPIPVAGISAGQLKITKVDGINDDFTRNADGTVTVNKAGNYDIAATVSTLNVGWPDNSNMNTIIARKNGALPVVADNITSVNQTTGSHANNYPAQAMTCTLELAVGDRIAIYVYQPTGSARDVQLKSFSITRTGAGPQGPAGPGGPLPAPEGWITATLSQGSHYGTPYGPVQYRKHAALGLVECRGLWTPGALGVMFVLPVGYRPTAGRELIFSCITGGAAADVRVHGDTGNVTWSASGTGWVSVTGVRFTIN